MNKHLLYAVAVTLSLTGCASMRGVDLGRGDTRTYPVDVTNRRTSTITVSYSGGGSEGVLGTVASMRTERFIIPMDAPASVRFTATTSSGTSVGSKTVTLQEGTAVRITFP